MYTHVNKWKNDKNKRRKTYLSHRKKINKLRVVVHTCNPHPQEVEAEE
jgi:hypothetical protein